MKRKKPWRQRIDTMISAHVSMRRHGQKHGEWLGAQDDRPSNGTDNINTAEVCEDGAGLSGGAKSR